MEELRRVCGLLFRVHPRDRLQLEGCGVFCSSLAPGRENIRVQVEVPCVQLLQAIVDQLLYTAVVLHHFRADVL